MTGTSVVTGDLLIYTADFQNEVYNCRLANGQLYSTLHDGFESGLFGFDFVGADGQG